MGIGLPIKNVLHNKEYRILKSYRSPVQGHRGAKGGDAEPRPGRPRSRALQPGAEESETSVLQYLLLKLPPDVYVCV